MSDDAPESHDDAQSDDQPSESPPTDTVNVEVDPDEGEETPDSRRVDTSDEEPDVPDPSEDLDKAPHEVTEDDLKHLSEEERQVAEGFGVGGESDGELDDSDGGHIDEESRKAFEEARQYEQDGTVPGDDGDDSDDESPVDDDHDPATLAETGITDDSDTFSWEEGFDEGTEWGEQSDEHFTYKGTNFRIQEPNDVQQLENATRLIEGIEDKSEDDREAAMFAYYEEIANKCLFFHDDYPLSEAYLVTRETPDGTQSKVFVQSQTDTDLSEKPNATPLWEAGNEMDMLRMGRRVDQFVSGEDQFQSRSGPTLR